VALIVPPKPEFVHNAIQPHPGGPGSVDENVTGEQKHFSEQSGEDVGRGNASKDLLEMVIFPKFDFRLQEQDEGRRALKIQ